MAILIKNVGYGIVSRSVKMQVFVSPETYLEIVNEARAYKLQYRSDSELINWVVSIFLKDLPLLRLERDRMKEALAQKNEIINKLQEVKKVKAWNLVELANIITELQ